MKVTESQSFYELKKLENYFYFYFGCGNGTGHISRQIPHLERESTAVNWSYSGNGAATMVGGEVQAVQHLCECQGPRPVAGEGGVPLWCMPKPQASIYYLGYKISVTIKLCISNNWLTWYNNYFVQFTLIISKALIRQINIYWFVEFACDTNKFTSDTIMN